MASRSKRQAVAQETVVILAQGGYTAPSGEVVSIASDLAHAVEYSELLTPTRLKRLARDATARSPGPFATRFKVANETTLAAARQLLGDGRERVLALNFASARNPGGGFLSGSQAQEESLARASGLYACLTRHGEMYDTNRRFESCVYTDHMIYSSAVPVFRDDDDALLERPYLVSFLTAPAVNAGAVRAKEADEGQIEAAMLARTAMVLAVAAERGYESLVLGAWGCGVFANDPVQVAGWFGRHLDGAFRGIFRDVVFAVYDHSRDQAIFQAFADRFGRQGDAV